MAANGWGASHLKLGLSDFPVLATFPTSANDAPETHPFMQQMATTFCDFNVYTDAYNMVKKVCSNSYHSNDELAARVECAQLVRFGKGNRFEQKVSFMEIPPHHPFRPDLAAATEADQCGGCLNAARIQSFGILEG
ncbi:hypothetical protein FIBSPDRAFT_886014 [Athelia psychrophila]|uniref:Uncharacterized protein n=1 Tax=Athelia psychrophila TaxID=1759441 RepID=A0A166RCS1_9AGAM|nr:hypothetical protein FIBSPDRAFT_886014 [Fibularhizoctonia sp. CBS 109695]